MGRFQGVTKVGIREKDTDKLVAVYPDSLKGEDKEIEKKVLDWYYMQDCSTSENIHKYYVDNLTERELKSIKK